MYASFYDAAMELNDEDFREYILALKDYALYGIEYTSRNPMVNALLTMAQPNLEAAAKRRAKQVKNGEYGILGGRPRKGETAEEYKARKAKTINNPMGFQPETLNVDVKVDENVKEDEKENENAKANVETWISNIANDCDRSDSIYTNKLFSSRTSNLGESQTDSREKPRQARPQQEVISAPSNQQKESRDQSNHRVIKCGNIVNLDEVEPAEPPIWLDCDLNDLPPLEDEGWTPPPPELQHNIIELPTTNLKTALVDGKKLQDLEHTISKEVQMLIDCEEGKKPKEFYSIYFKKATKALMEYNQCSKATAENMITQLKEAFRAELIVEARDNEGLFSKK